MDNVAAQGDKKKKMRLIGMRQIGNYSSIWTAKISESNETLLTRFDGPRP